MRESLMCLFIQTVNMGYRAGIAVGVILFVRVLLSRIHMPKKYICLLWLIPFLGLSLPARPQSVLSVFSQRTQPVPVEITAVEQPVIYINSELGGQIVTQTLPAASLDEEKGRGGISVNLFVLSVLWLAGAAFFLLYGVFSVIALKRRLRASVREGDNIYLADGISTAFVLGFHKPRIYLPSDIPFEAREYVISHEKMHIRRKDHIIKIVVFVLTCLYWYHPLIWAAYFLTNRDIEFACDEAVVKEESSSYRQNYAAALLSLSVDVKRRMTIPLAFSEGSPKKRIKYIVSYKKPLFFLGTAGIIVILMLAVGLLTDPVSKASNGEGDSEAGGSSETEGNSGTESSSETENNSGAEGNSETESNSGAEDNSGTERDLSDVHYAELENVMMASSAAQLADGREVTVELWMTGGAYYDESWEDYLPSIYSYDRNYEGNYAVLVKNEDGDILSRTDLGDLWPDNGSTFNFPGEFKLEWADYNGDGCPDFSIGIPYSSSNMGFLLFTVQEDGALKRLGNTDILLNSFEKFSVIFEHDPEKEGKPIMGYWYNSATGEVENTVYFYHEYSGLYEE